MYELTEHDRAINRIRKEAGKSLAGHGIRIDQLFINLKKKYHKLSIDSAQIDMIKDAIIHVHSSKAIGFFWSNRNEDDEIYGILESARYSTVNPPIKDFDRYDIYEDVTFDAKYYGLYSYPIEAFREDFIDDKQFGLILVCYLISSSAYDLDSILEDVLDYSFGGDKHEFLKFLQLSKLEFNELFEQGLSNYIQEYIDSLRKTAQNNSKDIFTTNQAALCMWYMVKALNEDKDLPKARIVELVYAFTGKDKHNIKKKLGYPLDDSSPQQVDDHAMVTAMLHRLNSPVLTNFIAKNQKK